MAAKRQGLPGSWNGGLGSALAKAARARYPTGASTSPPTGFYDPALDAAQRAGDRGLAQLQEDLAKQNQRAESQYQLQKTAGETGAQRTLADLMREHTRFGEDVGTKTGREGQDYTRSLEGLSRSFQRLGQSQAQSATSRGLGQGALAAAMKARQGNEAIQRQPLDIGHQRFGEDISRQTGREAADYGTNTARVNEDLATGTAALGLDYGYGVADRATQGSRAALENLSYGQDIGAQKLYQAGQAGWVAPPATQSWSTLAAQMKRRR